MGGVAGKEHTAFAKRLGDPLMRHIKMADSTDRRNTLPLYLARWNGMHMEGHARTWFHAEAEGRALIALEERPMGGRRRPSARGTRAVSKILALNGGIAPAPWPERSSE